MSNVDNFNSLLDLETELKDYIKVSEKPLDIIEFAAKEFVSDLKKLPKPISKVKRNGYTHLVKTFSYQKKKDEMEVCWGKYYGPMVENGTSRMNARPHLRPLWDKNKEKYIKIMTKNIYK